MQIHFPCAPRSHILRDQPPRTFVPCPETPSESGFKLTTFGESHGPALGGVLDGMPAGSASTSTAASRTHRRAPGTIQPDHSAEGIRHVTLLSGVFEGRTTGTPIGFTIPNGDAKPGDYSHLEGQYRPSHADYTYDAKYGVRDHRGGGRVKCQRNRSPRAWQGPSPTVPGTTLSPRARSRCGAYVERVQDIAMPIPPASTHQSRRCPCVRCPDPETARRMEARILDVKKAGDTVGGSIVVVAKAFPRDGVNPYLTNCTPTSQKPCGASGSQRPRARQRVQRHLDEGLRTQRHLHRQKRQHPHHHQPQWRHTRRHQQWRRHRLRVGFQTRRHLC